MNTEFFRNLYYYLWTSAEFESDFQANWFAVYQILQENKADDLPDNVVAMVALWCHDYFEKEQ